MLFNNRVVILFSMSLQKSIIDLVFVISFSRILLPMNSRVCKAFQIFYLLFISLDFLSIVWLLKEKKGYCPSGLTFLLVWLIGITMCFFNVLWVKSATSSDTWIPWDEWPHNTLYCREWPRMVVCAGFYPTSQPLCSSIQYTNWWFCCTHAIFDWCWANP